MFSLCKRSAGCTVTIIMTPCVLLLCRLADQQHAVEQHEAGIDGDSSSAMQVEKLLSEQFLLKSATAT